MGRARRGTLTQHADRLAPLSLFIAALCLLALAPAAQAAQEGMVTFKVVNDKDILQSGVSVYNVRASGTLISVGHTDQMGLVSVKVYSTEVYAFSRNKDTSPEKTNVRYTIPDPVPAGETIKIVLPSLSDPDYIPTQPALDNGERRLLGQITRNGLELD